MKLNFTPKYIIALLFLILFSCSVKNSTLKKGAEMEKLVNFKQASELYLSVLYRKSNLPEIENALRRSAQLHISETAFYIATKNEKNDKEGVVDFIDVKTGDKARLSTEQRELQKLIDKKQINFIKLKR
jgi:hypothetical protein